MVQNYWTPKHRPANAKIIASSFFFAFVVEVYPNVSPGARHVFAKNSPAPRSRNVLGNVPRYLPWRQPIFPWRTGLQSFGFRAAPVSQVDSSEFRWVAPVHWLKTKKTPMHGTSSVMERSTPTQHTQNQTLTMYVWYIYLHLSYFTVKNNQM